MPTGAVITRTVKTMPYPIFAPGLWLQSSVIDPDDDGPRVAAF